MHGGAFHGLLFYSALHGKPAVHAAGRRPAGLAPPIKHPGTEHALRGPATSPACMPAPRSADWLCLHRWLDMAASALHSPPLFARVLVVCIRAAAAGPSARLTTRTRCAVGSSPAHQRSRGSGMGCCIAYSAVHMRAIESNAHLMCARRGCRRGATTVNRRAWVSHSSLVEDGDLGAARGRGERLRR